MTERGLPKVDGPVACPFVAFDDDRDGRNTVPDHRHRCYAETPAAPRALAHQEAYCLAPAFPVCPVFQDWARREAAHARNDAPAAGRSDSRGDARGPGMLPVDAALAGAAAGSGDDDAFADEEPIYEDPGPRRNPRRAWASPPPWMNRGEGRPGDAAGVEPHDPAFDAAEAGLAGSVADRLAASTRGAAAESDSAAGPGSRAQSARTEGHLSDDDLQPAEERDDWDTRADDARNARPPAPEPAPRYRERERARTEPTEPDGRLANARQGVDRKHEVAPSWERPARLEAYPTLRSRRMPNIAFPPILVALVALLLAALILFLLPGFLGLGSPQAGASPTPVTQSSSGPLGSVGPTVVPQPTQQLYTVQAGDTMSRIANKFHVPLATLVDANKTNIPDPNKLKIGDQVIIPSLAAPGTSPGASP
ncbi:MAG TPA: LysM domain-containing protein [Candidatus Limnocylindrales bacterium]|nr:LysM domain-containing protein [Candidatus Limnocylindrales bacterium]